MTLPQRKRIPLLILSFLTQLFLCGLLWTQYQSVGYVITPDSQQNKIGGNDWVTWKNVADGVQAYSIHPIIKNHSQYQNSYIKRGDILKKIDYLEVYKSGVVDTIVYSSPPGRVFIYNIDRMSSDGLSIENINLFIRSSYHPVFSFIHHPKLWNTLKWFFALGSLLSLLAFLILFPFIKANPKNNILILLVLSSSFGLFFTLLIKEILLVAESDLSQFSTEYSAMGILLSSLALYAIGYSALVRRKGPRFLVLLSIFPQICLFLVALFILWTKPFALFSGVVIGSVFGSLICSIGLNILFSSTYSWNEKSITDKVLHMFSGAYLLLTLIVYIKHEAWNMAPTVIPREKALFLIFPLFFIPLFHSVAGELKFGKVIVVLSKTILYLVVAAFVFFLLFVIQEILMAGGIDSKYRLWFALGILILILIILRSLYDSFEGRVRNYFILSSQKEEENFKKFISQIPRFTSSENLISVISEKTCQYFDIKLSFIRFSDNNPTTPNDPFDQKDIRRIKKFIQEEDKFWSSNKFLSPLMLPDYIEKKAITSEFSQIHFLKINEEKFGILVLGSKKRGVFNLSDLELISRMNQQIQLTLDVLNLVEREKLLLEKNYEANLTVLRSQINPHFLFNTLNTISSLIHDAPDEAEEAVDKLAYIFRHTLEFSAENLVTIDTEFNLVRTYLEIEKMRFGKRLTVEWEIDESLLETLIPSLVVQTVVENCVKHGIRQIVKNGLIRIRVFKKDNFVTCDIYDNGPGIDHANINRSTGLSNSITRVEKIFKQKGLLSFVNTGEGTLVELKIPI